MWPAHSSFLYCEKLNNWIINRQSITTCGFAGTLEHQRLPFSTNHFKVHCILQQRIKYQFLKTWSSELNISGKCINYRMFKTSLHLADYPLTLSLSPAMYTGEISLQKPQSSNRVWLPYWYPPQPGIMWTMLWFGRCISFLAYMPTF